MPEPPTMAKAPMVAKTSSHTPASETPSKAIAQGTPNLGGEWSVEIKPQCFLKEVMMIVIMMMIGTVISFVITRSKMPIIIIFQGL